VVVRQAPTAKGTLLHLHILFCQIYPTGRAFRFPALCHRMSVQTRRFIS
jgi:hypothetical protein